MWLEGGGEEDKSAGVEGREAVTSLRPSFSFRAAALPPPSLELCSVDGGMDSKRQASSSPPLFLSGSSSALWSWMELNANDLTELKSSKNKTNKQKKICFYFSVGRF